MSDMERTHYLSCAPESYDSTAIYGVFDTWAEARDAAMNAEYLSVSAEIQEWAGRELLRTWGWKVYPKSWTTGWGDDSEERF